MGGALSTGESIKNILSQLSDVHPIKVGGQKEVSRAFHPQWGSCVLKIGKSHTPVSLERARREISVQNALGTDYYPQIFYFSVCDNTYYVIEEFIESDTLGELLASYSGINSIFNLIKEISQALSPLWEMGIAHRDVKPENILITNDGSPKIIDLGILRDPSADSLTLSLAPLGPCTPAYASPEQLTNAKHLIDPRTDQFSIGIITFQLLTKGLHPFDPSHVGCGESIPQNIASGKWSKNTLTERNFNDNILGFISRCLSHLPYGRYRNFDQLIKAINSCIGG